MSAAGGTLYRKSIGWHQGPSIFEEPQRRQLESFIAGCMPEPFAVGFRTNYSAGVQTSIFMILKPQTLPRREMRVSAEVPSDQFRLQGLPRRRASKFEDLLCILLLGPGNLRFQTLSSAIPHWKTR